LTEDRWLSVDEIGAHLGVSRDTIYAWIAQRGLPAHRIGRFWKMQRAEVDAWVRAGRAADPPDEAAVSSGAPQLGRARAKHPAPSALARLAADDPDAAIELAAGVREDERAPRSERWGATMTELGALTALGRYRDALALVEEAAPRTKVEAAAIEAHRMRLLAELGEYREATKAARRVARHPEDVDEEVVARAANLLAGLGHHREALPLADRAAKSARVEVQLRAYGMYVEGGEIERARAVLARLGEAASGEREARVIEVRQVPAALFAGELDGLEATISRLIARAPPSIVHALAVDAVTLATLRGRAAPKGPLRDDVPTAVGYLAEALALELARNDVRHAARGAGKAPAVAEDGPAWLRVRAGLVAAERLLVGGRGAAALAAARRTLAVARASGAKTLVSEALATMIDALLVAGDREDAELADAVRALRAVGEEAPSRRLVIEATLPATCLAPAADPAAIEAVAAEIDVAPVAARRARALLGGHPPLDAIDRAVVAALRARRSLSRLSVVVAPESEWTPSWRWEEAALRVVLPGGRAVDLAARSVQAALLLALARARQASKEDLVRAAWRVGDYHPHRDDKRLQAAIRALRDTVEDDARDPRRIVTTSTGYALGESERFLFVRAPGRPGEEAS
jgi:excisionase family DNA binding protein